MLTIKENFIETSRADGKPDRLVNQWEAIKAINTEPIVRYMRKGIERGKTAVDPWGITFIWPEDQPAAAPHNIGDARVIKEITEWEKQVSLPDIRTNATDWSEAESTLAGIDRNEYLVAGMLRFGLFERSHGLMGFEDALMNLYLEPDAYGALLDLLLEERFVIAELLIDHLKPDLIISHDDWGTKTSLFMSPDIWRVFFKSRYKKLYDYIHSRGVRVMHHADSFLEPIAEELAEIGVDLWQGVLTTNNIAALQEKLAGRMTLMGGIDTAALDIPNATEDEIRAEARQSCVRYGPGGHFIPCNTYGSPLGTIYPHVDVIASDEIAAYNREVYGHDSPKK